MARATGMGLDVERHAMEFDWCVQVLVEETLVRGGQRNRFAGRFACFLSGSITELIAVPFASATCSVTGSKEAGAAVTSLLLGS